MVPLVILVGGDGGSVGAVVDDASLEPAEKKTVKGLRIHSGKSVRKSIVQVRERCESFSEGRRNKELLLFHRPLQGEGKGGKYTCAWAGFFYFSRGNYSITREKTAFAEFRSQGRLEFMQHYLFSLLVLKSGYRSVPFLLVNLCQPSGKGICQTLNANGLKCSNACEMNMHWYSWSLV